MERLHFLVHADEHGMTQFTRLVTCTPSDRKRIRESGEGFVISVASEEALRRTMSAYTRRRDATAG
jgi:hypothetical protein